MPVEPIPCAAPEPEPPTPPCCSPGIASTGLCLADGTPISVLAVSACGDCGADAAAPEVTGWLNLLTSAYTEGPPPAGTEACAGQPQQFEVGQWCDLDAEGEVIAPVLVEYEYDEDGQLIGVRTLTPGGDPYTIAGTLGICPGPVDDVEYVILCDTLPDGTVVEFLRALTPNGDDTSTARDTTLDGATVYTPTGTVGVCQPPETCSDCQTFLLCDGDATSPATIAGTAASGTLSNSVQWSVTGPSAFPPKLESDGAAWWGSALFPNPSVPLTTFTFDQSVTAEFSVTLAYTAGTAPGQNTVQLPAGAQPLSLPPGYSYDQATSTLSVDATVTGCPQLVTPTREDSARFRVTGVSSFALKYLGPRVLFADCGVIGNWLFGAVDVSLPGQFLRTVCRDCDGAVISTTDTGLDGTTAYIPIGVVGVCHPPEPCRDTSSTLLCDTTTTASVTVFDPAGTADADGWEVVSFTGEQPGYGPTSAMPYPVYRGTNNNGETSYGARPDLSAGPTQVAWPGYDNALVRWVIRRTFTAPQDGTATVAATGFRADGGGRVRINGIDMGLYSQWGQPGVGGSGQAPVTVGLNIVEIEVRDDWGFNWATGKLDIVLTDTVEFMRRQVVDCESGQVVSVTDTNLDGEPYEVTGEVGQCQPVTECCPQQNTETQALCDTAADGTVTPFLRHYTHTEGGGIASVVDTLLDGATTYTPTGTVGLCQAEPTCTDAFTQMLCDEAVELTWTQTSVVPDPTQPDGRGFIYTLSPTDDPNIVGTIRVLVDRSYGSCGAPYWPGGATFTYELDAVAQTMETLRVNLQDFDTNESITMLAGGAPDRLGGNAYAAAGGVIRSNANNAYGYMFFDAPPATLSYRFGGSCTGLNFSAVSTRVDQFLRKVVTDCVTGAVVSVTDTTLDGQPYTVAGDIGECSVGTGQCCPDSELLTLCDTAADGTATSFLRHLIYPQGDGTPTATDTALDGVTEYVPTGTVGVCGGSDEPCRDASSTLLCDTAAQEAITVFDPSTRPGSDGWQVVSYTGVDPAFPAEAALPYDAPHPVGSPALMGARSDLSAGAGAAWTGYDNAPHRWVLRKTFQAPEDGVAVVSSAGFRGDGGARVRVNGTDAGMYGQWNQPATAGTAQIPVTAGPNVVEIEVRDGGGPNWVQGRLDIVMTATVQFMRRTVVDCDSGETVSVTDTTLDGEPYEVLGVVGQCEPVAECCEQPPPELRVDIETTLLCVRDEVTGEIVGQVIAERVYDDQSGDLVEQRLTDLTGDPFTLPDGAELAKCPTPDRITRQVCVVESGTAEFLTNTANAASGVDEAWQWSPDLSGNWHPMYRVAPNALWTVTDTAPNQAHWVGPHADRTVCPTAAESSPPVPETWYTRASWNLPVDVTPESIRIAATVLNADNDVVQWRLNDGAWQPVGTAGLGGAAWTFPPTAVPGGRAGQNEVIVQLFEAQPAVGCPSPNSAGMLLHVIATYDHEPLVWTQVIEPGGQTYYLDETGARQDTIPDGRRLVACDSGGPATHCQDCETLTLCDSIADEESPGGIVLTEYEPIPLSTLPPSGRFGDGSPVAGVLANGVAWTVNVGTWDTPQDHYSFYPGDNPQTWTFDQPVYLRIGYRGLNISPQECYRIPEGAVLESLNPAHTYDEAGRYLCEIVGTSTAADESVFTLGPVTVLDVDAVGSSTGGRGLGTLEVAIEDEQPGPVEPGGVLVPFLRTVCRDCDGVVTSTTDTTLDGEEYTVLGVTTVCSSTGGSSGEAPAPDIEVIRLCDLVDGADAVPFLRHLVYTAGAVAPTVVDTALDGVTPYAAVGDAGVCPVPTPGRDVELVPMCVLDNGTGASIQEIYAEVRYDAESGERVGVTYVDPLTWGPVALPGGTHIGLCPAAEEPEPMPDVEVVQLCDMVDGADPVPFLRHLVYAAGAVTPTVVDSALDGVTPYATVGTVGTCRSGQHVVEQCRCDDTDGDGIGDTDYVELIAVDTTAGTLTTIGTYLPDYSGPYTPVAPVECPAEGAEPAVIVQARRVELAAGGTWSAASVQLLQSVTATAHDGPGVITTADGTSTLHAGESVSWSVARDGDNFLSGPLAITSGHGASTVTVAFTTATAT